MTLPKRVLIGITTSNEVFYDDGFKTGLFWSEAVHPYHLYKKAGFEVEFTSETGEFSLDDHSIVPPFISEEDLAEYNDQNAQIHKDLAKIKKTSDVKASDYGIFFAAGGHACLFDFPTARQLQDVAEEIYENGGIVAAVCHGPAILEDIHDRSTGALLVQGKKVTAFSDEAETLLNLDSALKRHNLANLEPFFKKAGALYSAPPEPFGSYAVTDGRLVTGANPASASDTAEQTITSFNKHQN